jgi:glutamine cyclotransferase
VRQGAAYALYLGKYCHQSQHFTEGLASEDPFFISAMAGEWDYSALRASPLRGRPGGRYPRFVAVAVD